MDDLDRFIKEDLGDKGDITSQAIAITQKGRGKIVAKEDCILAGLQEAQQTFLRLGAHVIPLKKDGDYIKKNEVVLHVEGPAQALLAGERLALNFLGKMSGIATLTRDLVEKCRDLNPRVSIAATRKTTPGFRTYEKKAVVLGGGDSHRRGLYDAILIKDNHIALVGSLNKALDKVFKKTPGVPIEVEVENHEDALLAAQRQVEYIMLDNIPPQKGKIIAKAIREINPQVKIEVSGGITPTNITQYTYADRISLGCLTHSVASKDFSLDISTKNIN